MQWSRSTGPCDHHPDAAPKPGLSMNKVQRVAGVMEKADPRDTDEEYKYSISDG